MEMKKCELQQLKKTNEVDADSEFLAAATEGNIKMLTQLSKNIEELGLEYIKAAHDIAVKKGDQAVITLTKLAMDKKEKMESAIIEEPKFNVKTGKNYQKSRAARPEEAVEVLEPEVQFEQPKHVDDGDFSETVVKTMPDGSVMRMK
ncbi:unnamed protein product, partial [Meganyctiphanes norvegica]